MIIYSNRQIIVKIKINFVINKKMDKQQINEYEDIITIGGDPDPVYNALTKYIKDWFHNKATFNGAPMRIKRVSSNVVSHIALPLY